MILIYITASSRTEASKIAKHLVKSKLAVCVNYSPVSSVYSWKDKVVSDNEYVLIVKTQKGNYTKIEKEVRAMHSYECPCIISVPIEQGNKDYLSWLREQLS